MVSTDPLVLPPELLVFEKAPAPLRFRELHFYTLCSLRHLTFLVRIPACNRLSLSIDASTNASELDFHMPFHDCADDDEIIVARKSIAKSNRYKLETSWD
jgi:hypothetical protein